MAITKRPAKPADNSASIDAFISGAPDAKSELTTAPAEAPKRVKKGRKIQITLTITEAQLARVDEKADQIGQSRAAVINLAIAQMLESGITLGGAS